MAFRQRSFSWKKWVFYGCLIALPLIQFFIMYVYVNFNSLTMAFKSYDMDTGWKWIGFENFKEIFKNLKSSPELKAGVKNSIITWIATTLVSIPLGLLFGYYIFKKFPGSKIFAVLLFLPSVVSANILTIIFKYYGDNFLTELINKIFGTTYIGLLSDTKTIFPTMLIFSIFIGFGVSIFMYSNAMSNISKEVLEAAKLDGANSITEFFTIILPQMTGTIMVFVISGLAGMFVTQLNLFSIYHVYADPETVTLGYIIYRNVYLAGESYAAYPYNAALGILATAIIAPLIVLARTLATKLDPMK